MKKPLIGVIEAGSARLVAGVGREGEGLLETVRIPGSSPGETMAQVFSHFRTMEETHGKIEALGVASFGPLDLDPKSPTYGYITHTPQSAWRNFNFLGSLASQFLLPTSWDTDVNAAVLAESLWGAGKGVDHVLYLSVGTRISGAFRHHGRTLHGLTHPEMGHLLISRDERRDAFTGTCPVHKFCLEGLASGAALEARWKTIPADLPASHPAWDLEAEYLGRALASLVLTLSPERIILGGGIGRSEGLLVKVREQLREALGNYVQHPAITERLNQFLVPPALGKQSTLMGAFALGMMAWREGRSHLAPEL